MRRFMLLVMVLSVFAWVLPARADDPGITTIGTGTVYAAPDLAVFSVSIGSIDPDVMKACAVNEENAGKLLKAIKAAGVADADIATGTLSISIHYRDVPGVGRSERDGYAASRSYSVKLKDLKQIEKVFNAMVNAGVDATPYVEMQVSNPRPFKDQARLLAIKAAQEKAVALAKEVNLTVGKAVSITEGAPSGYGGGGYGQMQTNASMVDERPLPDAPENTPLGRIAVQATVTARFELK